MFSGKRKYRPVQWGDIPHPDWDLDEDTTAGPVSSPAHDSTYAPAAPVVHIPQPDWDLDDTSTAPVDVDEPVDVPVGVTRPAALNAGSVVPVVRPQVSRQWQMPAAGTPFTGPPTSVVAGRGRLAGICVAVLLVVAALLWWVLASGDEPTDMGQTAASVVVSPGSAVEGFATPEAVAAAYWGAWCRWDFREEPTARQDRTRVFLTSRAAADLAIDSVWWRHTVVPSESVATCGPATITSAQGPDDGVTRFVTITGSRAVTDTGGTAMAQLSEQRVVSRELLGGWLVDRRVEGD